MFTHVTQKTAYSKSQREREKKSKVSIETRSILINRMQSNKIQKYFMYSLKN